ncbi:MAG: DUF4097 domain-containing protein [Lachnospiraceae bacterium]|nr:DUF4097 domain-containing protein [Lachnospiraceae bacterium]
MNKFMRGCLMTALVLLIIGFVISGVCWLLGGYRQLNGIQDLTGIPFVFFRGDGRHWSIGFGDKESEFGKDWEKERYLRIGDEESVSYLASSFKELDVELGACTLYLQESADDQIYVSVEGNTLRYYYLVDGSTLRLRNAGRTKRIAETSDKVYLSLPAGFQFREADVMIGAGKLEGGTLLAEDLSLDVGAGECSMEKISGREVRLNLGAGKIRTQQLEAEELTLDGGAGEYKLEGVFGTEDMKLKIGMGNARIEGEITGDLSVDCGMGSVDMRLAGSEDDHAYDVECNMGNVKVSNKSIGGFSGSREWNSGRESVFEIECSMGNVTIAFEE